MAHVTYLTTALQGRLCCESEALPRSPNRLPQYKWEIEASQILAKHSWPHYTALFATTPLITESLNSLIWSSNQSMKFWLGPAVMIFLPSPPSCTHLLDHFKSKSSPVSPCSSKQLQEAPILRAVSFCHSVQALWKQHLLQTYAAFLASSFQSLFSTSAHCLRADYVSGQQLSCQSRERRKRGGFFFLLSTPACSTSSISAKPKIGTHYLKLRKDSRCTNKKIRLLPGGLSSVSLDGGRAWKCQFQNIYLNPGVFI